MGDMGENEHLELMSVNMLNYSANSCPKYSILEGKFSNIESTSGNATSAYSEIPHCG